MVTMNFNVQTHARGISFDLPDEALDDNLPGQLNLTFQEADDLRSQLNQAVLDANGNSSYRSIRWNQAREGDVVSGIGMRLSTDPQITDTHATHGCAILEGGGKLTLPFSTWITVERR